jgi:hypothetical protein
MIVFIASGFQVQSHFQLEGKCIISAKRKRFGLEHVGQVFDENDNPRAQDLIFFKGRESPLACRRKPEYKLG